MGRLRDAFFVLHSDGALHFCCVLLGYDVLLWLICEWEVVRYPLKRANSEQILWRDIVYTVGSHHGRLVFLLYFTF